MKSFITTIILFLSLAFLNISCETPCEIAIAQPTTHVIVERTYPHYYYYRPYYNYYYRHYPYSYHHHYPHHKPIITHRPPQPHINHRPPQPHINHRGR